MKTILTYSVPFTLNAGTANTSTLDFSAVPSYNQKFLYAVTNSTTKQTVYATGQTGLSGTSSGNILTLNLACAGMSSGDVFTVIYDLSGSVTSVNSTSIVQASDASFLVSGASAVGVAPTLNPVAVSGVDAGGLKRHIKMDSSGRIEINTAQSLPLPALAATSTKQSDGSQKTQIVDGSGLVVGPLITSTGNALPISISANDYKLSTVNTTTAQLASGATFTGGIETTFNQPSYSILLTSDQNGTLTLKQYIDAAGTFLAQSSVFNILAGQPFARSNAVNGNYFNLTFQNTSGATTTTLNINTAYGTIPSTTQLNNAPTSLNEVNGSVISLGQTTMSGSLPVAIASNQTLPLPAGAATSAAQTSANTTLSSIDTKTPALGQTTMSGSTPVVFASNQTALPITGTGIPTALGQQAASASLAVALANEDVQDQYVTGQSAQTAVVNNILTVASGAAATDLLGYRSFSVQVVSTGTAGTFIFEGSNDNVNFQTIPVFSQLILTGTPITAAITATASQLIYQGASSMRYIRLRIATTITGGSIQAFSKFSLVGFQPNINQVAQNTAANLLTTTTIGSGTVTTVSTVTSVTSAQAAIPGIINDVASAALTTTTTTATLTPTFGSAYSVTIPVTVVSGTTPTLDVQIQESDDTGTNWVAVYDFPRITATGFYRSPVLTFTGNRIRYVQTVSGTTPSFTRAINRLQSSISPYSFHRQQIDRTIVLTTANSITPSLTIGSAGRVQLSINIGAATTAPILQMEGSDDNGTTWYSIGGTLTATASATVQLTVADINSQLIRARVSTAGTAVTAGYVMIKAF